MKTLRTTINQKYCAIDNRLFSFKNIQDLGKNDLLSIFKKMSLQISHIYGSQKKSFRKILENQDRNTYVLSLNGINIGILTYKTILQNEYNAYIYDYIKQYDIKDVFLRGRYIELKSLFLYDKDFMGKGYVYALLHKLVSECSSNPSLSKADGIFVSVSSGKADKSLAMFKKL
jgi:hypothetical protein